MIVNVLDSSSSHSFASATTDGMGSRSLVLNGTSNWYDKWLVVMMMSFGSKFVLDSMLDTSVKCSNY